MKLSNVIPLPPRPKPARWTAVMCVVGTVDRVIFAAALSHAMNSRVAKLSRCRLLDKNGGCYSFTHAHPTYDRAC